MMIGESFSGQPQDVGQPTCVKKAIMATPMQISGITMGSAIAPSYPALKGKRKRQRRTATMAPRTVAKIVLKKAMVMEFPKASSRSSLFRAFT